MVQIYAISLLKIVKENLFVHYLHEFVAMRVVY